MDLIREGKGSFKCLLSLCQMNNREKGNKHDWWIDIDRQKMIWQETGCSDGDTFHYRTINCSYDLKENKDELYILRLIHRSCCIVCISSLFNISDSFHPILTQTICFWFVPTTTIILVLFSPPGGTAVQCTFLYSILFYESDLHTTWTHLSYLVTPPPFEFRFLCQGHCNFLYWLLCCLQLLFSMRFR